MEKVWFIHVLLVHGLYGFSINITGPVYMEAGKPYTLTCSVDSYLITRDYTYTKYLNEESSFFYMRYSKTYGCYVFENEYTLCTENICSCDDNGLSVQWTHTISSDLSTASTLSFVCASANENGELTTSLRITPTLAHGPGSSLTFNSSNEFVTTVLGQEFSIICLADCKPICQFEWTKSNFVVNAGPILYIKKLSKDDHGAYLCRAFNGYGNETKQLFLTINYGPEFVTLLPNSTQYNVTEGNTVQPIKCTADCRPVCNLTWSGPNVPDGTKNVLLLDNIQKNQTGLFNCAASNNVDSLTSSDVNINVQFGPGSSLQFKPGNTSITKNKGDKLGPINCSASCNPTCQYKWTKPDKTTINGSQLIITSLSLEDHGQFICSATNAIGDSQNKSLNMTVNYGPNSVTIFPPDTQYTVTEGDTLQPIKCTANCRPVCNYMWYGPNVNAGTDNVLDLQNIQRYQSGVFNCTAFNDVDSEKSSNVKLNVQFGPGSSLQFEPTNISVTMNKGDKLGPIECRATCNPPCEFNWTKPDTKVMNNAELTIESLINEDNGLFICTASNGIGDSQKKNLNVTVNYGPVDVIISPQTKQYTVRYGQNIPPINCTANCRPECVFIWSGPNVLSDDSNVLSLQNIQKNQSGDFNCTAVNGVGSMQSFVINVDVQYEPFVNEISINGTNFTVRENTTVILSCNFDGNPAPKTVWKKNDIILSEVDKSNKLSFYTIQPADCNDSGNYSCVANNLLGISSDQQSLFVTCSPRLNVEAEQPPTKIGLPKGADLNLTVHLISYPTPISTVWIFTNNNRNETIVASNLDTYDMFKHVTVLTMKNLTQLDFGDYILKVQNTEGTATQAYQVVPQGPPDPTSLLNVTCDELTALLYWRTSFNGGERQNFSIIINKDEKEQYIQDTNIYDDGHEHIKFVTITLSAGDYIFKIYGKNSYGNQNSSNQMRCQVQDDYKNESSLSVSAAVGGGTAAAVCVVVVIVLFVFIKKRRSTKGDDGRKNLTTEDKDDDDGLKENPLYISSGEASNDSGPLYSVVTKSTKTSVTDKTGTIDQGSVYSQVQKIDIKGKKTTNKKDMKKTGKPGHAGKDMEMGSVYENSKNLLKCKENDEVYANAVDNATTDKIYRPTKNKDGLIYADLDLAPCAGGNKFFIRGLENKSNYAIIDLTKTAEPLPSDEEEDGAILKETTQDNS